MCICHPELVMYDHGYVLTPCTVIDIMGGGVDFDFHHRMYYRSARCDDRAGIRTEIDEYRYGCFISPKTILGILGIGIGYNSSHRMFYREERLRLRKTLLEKFHPPNFPSWSVGEHEIRLREYHAEVVSYDV